MCTIDMTTGYDVGTYSMTVSYRWKDYAEHENCSRIFNFQALSPLGVSEFFYNITSSTSSDFTLSIDMVKIQLISVY